MGHTNFGDRIRQQRQELGLTQANFAMLGNVARPTQAHYESEARTPDLKYLAALNDAGVDIFFIITGEHQPSTKHPALKPTSEQSCITDPTLKFKADS